MGSDYWSSHTSHIVHFLFGFLVEFVLAPIPAEPTYICSLPRSDPSRLYSPPSSRQGKKNQVRRKEKESIGLKQPGANRKLF